MFESGWGDNSPEWDRFYSFMIACISVYLELGLTDYNKVNLDERKLRVEVPEEFLDFATEEVGKLKEGQTIYRDDIFEGFATQYPIYGPKGKLEKTQKVTTRWFLKLLKFYKVEIKDQDDRIDAKRKKGWKLVA